jgi:tRNA pseudouridine55 synthase
MTSAAEAHQNPAVTLAGLLLVDKPIGPTSHDVVARVRRVLRERRIGHTGTLDPMASGLLPLVIGRATRLAPVLTGSDKTYDATIRLGVATTTDDAMGEAIGESVDVSSLADEAIRDALDGFRGTFDQRPPTHSAKKIGGVKAYELARQAKDVPVVPVPVTVHAIDWLGRTANDVSIRVTAAAGFYVRALARDLGERLGCGAHLVALRRVRSGPFGVDRAVPLAELEAGGRDAVVSRLVTPEDALPHLPGVALNEAGLKRAVHGNWVGPEHVQGPVATTAGRLEDGRSLFKLLAPNGRLVGLAKAKAGAWHPVVVLG